MVRYSKPKQLRNWQGKKKFTQNYCTWYKSRVIKKSTSSSERLSTIVEIISEDEVDLLISLLWNAVRMTVKQVQVVTRLSWQDTCVSTLLKKGK